jgi:uncharacterized protein DUF1579
MTRCSWTLCRIFICGLLGCCLAVTGGFAADAKAPAAKPAAKPAAPSEQDMMAAMIKAGTPGPQHEALKAMAGSWKAQVKSWMGPGEPQVSEGTSELSVILGGRFLKDEFHGTFGGQPFEGYGLTGYDNMKKMYVGTWVDSFGTTISSMSGKMDAAGKVLTMHGTYEDPLTHKKSHVRYVTKIVDANNHVFEMYGDSTGKEMKQMEITYTRK